MPTWHSASGVADDDADDAEDAAATGDGVGSGAETRTSGVPDACGCGAQRVRKSAAKNDHR